MKREQGIERLDDTMRRKYVVEGNVAYVYWNPYPEDGDTHARLAISQGLDPSKTVGGYLKVENKTLVHKTESMTVGPGSQEVLDKVTDIEIF